MKHANKAKVGKPPMPKKISERDSISVNDVSESDAWSWRNRFKSLGYEVGSEVCFMLILATYLRTLHPSVPGGDAGELMVAASEGGVAHPPGYPLFMGMAQLAIGLLRSWGTVAWSVNLLTAVTAALASACLYAAICRMTGQVSAAVLGVGLFSYSRLTWQWSVTGEVFALNSCLIATVLLHLVMFHTAQTPAQRDRISVCGAFFCGLCLSNQHTSVVYVAVLGAWVLACLILAKELTWGKLLKLPVAFLCGLSPYLLLPLKSMGSSARWTWGDQSSLPGFLKHLLREEYGTFHLLQGHTGQGMLHGLRIFFDHVYEDLTPACLLLLVCLPLSLCIKVRRGREQVKVVAVCLSMLLLYLGLFTWRANLDTANPLFLGVVERFWLQSDLVLAFLAAVGFSYVSVVLDRVLPVKKWRLDVLAAVAVVMFQMQRNFQASDQSGNVVVRDFADQVLRSMPQGAIVLTKGDLPSNSIRYLHLCEGVRPDITLLDQEVLTLEWSVPMYRRVCPNISFPGDILQPFNGIMPDGRTAFNFKAFLDANYNEKRPMYGCIGVQDHEGSWMESYELWPFGVCQQFIRKGSKLHLDDWVARTRAMQYHWPYPLDGYDNRSWEKVATEEMWSSRTAAALSLLEKSELFAVGKEKKAILTYSYQLYKEAMSEGKGFPAYWHKNFALVCEKLSWAEGGERDVSLMGESADHFTQFLKLDPADSDADKIREAIKSLREFVAKATKVQSS